MKLQFVQPAEPFFSPRTKKVVRSIILPAVAALGAMSPAAGAVVSHSVSRSRKLNTGASDKAYYSVQSAENRGTEDGFANFSAASAAEETSSEAGAMPVINHESASHESPLQTDIARVIRRSQRSFNKLSLEKSLTQSSIHGDVEDWKTHSATMPGKMDVLRPLSGVQLAVGGCSSYTSVTACTTAVSACSWVGGACEEAASSDTTAPVFENGTPSLNNAGDTSVVINVDIDEAGSAYAVVVADGDAAPSAAQVIAGRNASNSFAFANNGVNLGSGGFSGTISLTGLTAGTAYDIYVVAQDDESSPNRSASPIKVDVNTTSPNNAPDVDLNGGSAGNDNTASFSEGSGAIAIASSATATETDGDTITTITVSLTNDQDGAAEGLNVTAAAQDALTGISGSSDITLQDTISITGATASVAEVQTFLQAITYNNTSDTPSETARTVTVVINDGTDNSTTRTSTISVTNVTATTTAATGFNTTIGTGLSPTISFSNGNETLTIGSTGHTTGTADGVGGTNTLVSIDGANISGWTLSNFNTLTVPDSSTLTLTSAQHNLFSTFTNHASQTLVLASGSDAVTSNANIETYQLGASYSGSLTLGSAGQNVTGSTGDDTLILGSVTYTGTLAGGSGTDALVLANGTDISGATVSGFENLTLVSGASVTMTVPQQAQFSGTITAAATEMITIFGDGDFTTSTGIETYIVGDDSTNTRTITLSEPGTNIAAISSTDAITFDIGSLTYTGIINGNSTTADTISMANGADISGATLSGIEQVTLASGATVTASAGQVGVLTGTITAPGAETLNVTGDGNFTTPDNIETVIVGDSSTDSRTITLGSATTDVSATSGTDAVTFNLGALTYTGTLTGAGSDDIVRLGNGADITGATFSNVSNLMIDAGASVTMTEAQHDAFSSVTATGTNSVTISDATDGFSGNSDVENYTLGTANSITLGTSGSSLSQNVTGSTGDDTLTLGSATYTGTLAGGSGTDTLVLANGADISGATISGFENLTLVSGASVTMTVPQQAQFSGTITAAATEMITIFGDGDFTTSTGIETYIVGDDSTNTRTITLSEPGTNIAAISSTDAITFDIGSLTYTGIINGNSTTADTISMANGADISGATLSGIEQVTLASGATVTATAGQLGVLTGTITAPGAETLNVTGDGNFTTPDNIETVIVGDSSTDSRTITLGSASVSVTASSVTDAITFGAGTLTYTGTITGDSTVADTLTVDNGSDLTGATITGVANLTLSSGAGISLTPALFNGFSGTITAPGSETLTFSSGTLNGGNLSAIETLATLSQASADTLTLPAVDAVGKTLTAGDTGSDGFVVTGSAGSQTVTGSAGADTIDGGGGDDTLNPGAGTDNLTGGSGVDTFTGSSTDLNGDTITDLSADDSVLLTGITGLSSGDVSFSGGTTLQIDTDANTGNGYEVQMTLSNNAGNNLTVDSVSDAGSDTLVTFVSSNTDPVISISNTLVTDENSAAILTFSYTDADSNIVTAVQKTAPAHGSIGISGTSITYTPVTNYTGSDSFVLTLSDGNGYTADKTISVTVNEVSNNSGGSNSGGSNSGGSNSGNTGGTPPVNNDPVITLGSAINIDEDTSGTVSFSYTDADGDTVTSFVKSAPPHGSVSLSGTNITYIPEADYNGSDSFVLTLSDGNGYTTNRTINVTVNAVNDEPVANDDIGLSLTANSTGVYTLDVLANDTDADDDTLQIVWVTTSSGATAIQGNAIVLTTDTTGIFTLKYGISDGNDGTDSATVSVTISSDDALDPVLTPPADVEVNATGLFTKVNLGVATAQDSNGDILPVSLAEGTTHFEPGLHTVYWKAEDTSGREGKASQIVTVHPLISIGKDANTTEGTTHTVEVYLNGEAPAYPVTIPYTVSGTADSSDHDLTDGTVVINSGTTGSITFNVTDDDVTEGIETLVITLNSSLNLGSKSSYTLSIHEANVAPEVSVVVTQSDEPRFLVDNGTDEVTVTATVTDANADDTHTYQWVNNESSIVNTSSQENVFVFSPAGLTAGIYHLSLVVSDGTATTSTDIYIEVVDELATLGSGDSDGDQIPDNEEGYQDSDNDGIPDYQDAISECNVIQEHALVSENYLIEGEEGVCLRKGATLAVNETGGARLMADELTVDPQAQNVGGIFDFIAYGLSKPGQDYQIVLPQRLPVPADAVYRKYSAENGWTDFVEDAGNFVSSAAGEEGYCPPPGDSAWTQGLTEGHWCVQLTMTDGGLNDSDGLENSAIVDPGGVATRSDNRLPEAADDSISVTINSSVTIDVLSNDTDADNDSLSVLSATAEFGQVMVASNVLVYTAVTDFFGTDTIRYSVTDNNGGTASAVVTVNVVKSSGGTSTPSDPATSSSGSSGSSAGGMVLFVLGVLSALRRRWRVR